MKKTLNNADNRDKKKHFKSKNNKKIIHDSFFLFQSDKANRHEPNLKIVEQYDDIKPYHIDDYDINTLLNEEKQNQPWQPHDTVRYTFKLPSNIAKIKEITETPSRQKFQDIRYLASELPETYQVKVRECFDIWEKASTLKFVEDDDQFHHYVYSYARKDKVIGYAKQGQVDLKQGVLAFANDFNYDFKETCLHEAGHILNLPHPFSEPYSILNSSDPSFKKTQGFSVMNYRPYPVKRSAIVTPMPIDYLAVQTLYGKPKSGDNFFYLDDMITPPPKGFQHTVGSLPLFEGDYTVSAEKSYDDFLIDLRENGLSQSTTGMVYTPKDIKNVVASHGDNKLILNQMDNYINATLSKETTLVVDPEHCGHDVVSGFNLKRDKIILRREDRVYNPQRDYYVLKNNVQNCHDNNGITDTKCNAITIEFANKQKISLLDVNQSDKDLLDITNEYSYLEKQSLPPQLFSDFMSSFYQGTAVSFIQSITDELLQKYDCSPMQKKGIMLLLGAIYIYYSGNLIANLAGTAVSELLTRNFDFNPNVANFCGKTVSAAINFFNSIKNSDVETCTRAATSLIGGLVGNAFGFFCTEKIGKPLYQKLFATPQNKF